MVYIRGQHADYDTWADMGCPGWAWADVLPYFRKAEHNERLNDAWHGQNGPLNVADVQSPSVFSKRFVEAGIQAGLPHNPDFNGATQEGVGLYQVTQRAGERFSAAKAYLTPHRGRPNLHVMTGVTVDRVGLVQGVAREVHIVQGGARQTLTVRREIILSAGAFQSPAILMRSGIGPAAHLQSLGIEVLHDLPGVGENLHDHPDVVLVADAPGQSDLFGLSLKGAWKTLQAIFEWRRQRTGQLTTNFAEGGAFYKSSPEVPHPDIQLHFVVAKLVNHGRKLTWGHGYSVHACLLQPRSRGRVQLANRDPNSPPLIDPQFLVDPEDMRRLVGVCARPNASWRKRRWQLLAGSGPRRPTPRPMPRSSNGFARTPTPSTTRWAPAAWAKTTWPWWTPSCVCAACRACVWWTPRSCHVW